MFSIDDLKIVLTVADCGGFAAAARDSGVPTSTISRAVARLEEHTGVRIFQRSSRQMCLTEDGERLVTGAMPLLKELSEIVESVMSQGDELSGRLRVTAPLLTGSTIIADALLTFAKAHPKVVVELSITNSVADLVSERLDLAFRGGPVSGNELVVKKLWTVPYAIAASAEFVERVLGNDVVFDRARLESTPAIVANSSAAWVFRTRTGSSWEAQPTSPFYVNDPRVAVRAAAEGIGMVRVPRAMAIEAGLVVLDVSAVGEPEPRELYAVYPSRQHVPLRVRRAVDWVQRHVAEREL